MSLTAGTNDINGGILCLGYNWDISKDLTYVWNTKNEVCYSKLHANRQYWLGLVTSDVYKAD